MRITKAGRWSLVVLVVLVLFGWAHTHRYEVIKGPEGSLTVFVWDRWRHRLCFNVTHEVPIETTEEARDRRDERVERARARQALDLASGEIDSARVARIEQLRASLSARDPEPKTKTVGYFSCLDR